MRFKIFFLCFLVNTLNASPFVPHFSSSVNTIPGCQIAVVNKSSVYATVYGTFDDGTLLTPFVIMPDNIPHYINLFYQGYCHQTMYLDIADANGLHVYTKYTAVNTTINLLPTLADKLKIQVQ